jgi:hypothetical protein
MRTKKHYEDLFQRNPNTTVGFSLAAQAVYAAMYGDFPGPNEDDGTDVDEYRRICRDLRQKYGENLTVSEVRLEMKNVQPTTSTIVRNIPVDLMRKFKMQCAADGISQQDCFINLMRTYVRDFGG